MGAIGIAMKTEENWLPRRRRLLVHRANAVPELVIEPFVPLILLETFCVPRNDMRKAFRAICLYDIAMSM